MTVIAEHEAKLLSLLQDVLCLVTGLHQSASLADHAFRPILDVFPQAVHQILEFLRRHD